MTPIVRCGAAAVLGAVLVIGGGGCGGGGGGKGADVSKVVGSAGGSVEHASGVRIEVPAGALAGDATFTITRVSPPSVLPAGVTARSEAFDLAAGGAALATPVKVYFPLTGDDLALEKGSLGLYRWDGQMWLNTGGDVAGSSLSSATNGFSIWIIGTGRSLHKPLHFYNTGPYDAQVSIHMYELHHPDLDAPISPAWSFPVGRAVLPEVEARFPQGHYSFCAEWWKSAPDTTGGPRWVHRVVGLHPPTAGDWTYGLDQDSNDLVPETVWFDTGIPFVEGRCPGTENVGGGGGPPISLSGTWVLLMRCPSQSTDAVTITFQISQSGGAFSGAGTGADYDGDALTATIQGGYTASSNTIAGTVSISSGSTLVRIDSFSTTLSLDTGYVPFTITSHTGYEGCTVTGRFVKQGS